MSIFPKILMSSVFVLIMGCQSQSTKTVLSSDTLVMKDMTSKTLPSLDTLPTKDKPGKNERNNRLFVFVGEKIDFDRLPSHTGDFDHSARARYKILERIYGNYPGDIIEFKAYDHYGRFSFAGYKNVLLYVSEDSGKYYHEKYQYDDVYRTKNGRWAGSYSDEYGHSYNQNTTVKPEIIDFLDEVSYPIDTSSRKQAEPEFFFPSPYYKIRGNKAIAIYGNYVEELFRLRKEGVLTARKLFGNE